MKKKVFVVPTMVLPIPDTKGGAIERLLTTLIEENERYGYADLTVLSVSEEEAKKRAKDYKHTRIIYKKRKRIFWERLFMYAYVGFRKLFHLSLPYFNPNYLCVKKLAKEIKPDIVVMEGSGGENLFSLSKKVPREKMFLHLHHRFPANRRLNEIYGNVIAPSKFIAEKWQEGEQKMPQKSHVVFNCIEGKRFQDSPLSKQELRRKFGYEEEDFIILYCGRIMEEKGVKELVRAFLKGGFKNGKLLLIGAAGFSDSEQTDYVKELLSMMEGREEIRHLGYIENHKLVSYYKMADVQVIPSLCDEAAGLVSIEGMAAGLPIIATYSGGLPEYVGENALLIEKEGLEEGIVEKLSLLYERKDLREEMSEKGREMAKRFEAFRYYSDYMKAIGIREEKG